eukprot:1158309-Pelagomonas_calceolata.AAC.14
MCNPVKLSGAFSGSSCNTNMRSAELADKVQQLQAQQHSVSRVRGVWDAAALPALASQFLDPALDGLAVPASESHLSTDDCLSREESRKLRIAFSP